MKFLIVFTALATVAIWVPLAMDLRKWKVADKDDKAAMVAAGVYLVSVLIVLAYASTVAFQK